MKTAEVLAELKKRLDEQPLTWSYDREHESVRIEHNTLGKGMTLSLGSVAAKTDNRGEEVIDEVAYTIRETFTAMEKEMRGELPESMNIFPVIRSTSFPLESKEGHAFITTDHTAETRIFYALDGGTAYRLIDENMLSSLQLTAEQAKEIARFQVRKLPVSLKEDQVAGNLFYFMNENDGYDASRILNDSFLKEMREKIEGDMTVSVPHQDVLIVGDIRNETGYDVLAQMAMHFFTEGKVPITSLSFVYENDVLEPIFIMAKNRAPKEDGSK
ncbi:DUF1444 domain-containing protein [Planococcus lenghuensis]|uniref:DUF1444 domain-containing protein n=1 Tax=Planococcus lenghuensis TaxID=2213202 RepID=A0A1Q2KX38_9BACL|nr:DUF1444 domain-containing protein [Planococcus lenghuensis]AQQ52778.1 DUF1444 domain-containing protein [Planococcus lenghuensis]